VTAPATWLWPPRRWSRSPNASWPRSTALPHWGKIFTTPPQTLRSGYERLPGFLDLMRRFDPSGKFRNAYTDRYLAT